ncbi:hypothetical protein L2E82_47871 [Cichorium intybus]|uniref:Uncharacterized protein n=1 Tax=Cichorium intybus TaxID=13427 RepID=A0ACB8YWT1_CICIN|nr:hypothetical protein L2E82_47871 [Cichorium intybus]
MADDVTRWSVTYTKHIKQKRKVYQDGFLEVQSSSHKVKLYDDCDKLLENKIVKLDDAVRSGETITLGAYLVDIGDPQGDTKPIPNLILQRDKTIANKSHMSNTKTSNGKASSINLSPSQKIIREFKRREVKKYYSPTSFPDKTKDDSTEWEVLYTTQLTQKAKKFHDGILKVAIAGLRGRQAVLYDETRKQLDSKFLKNDEVITAGESMKFDGHIVDIIELKDHKPLKDTNVDGRNCNKQNTMQSKIHNEHLNEFKKHETNKFTTKTDLKEWDVMYTTQVTQKAKKFHDGVLKLSSCGSQGREEATLLSEDGTVLSHRYLKLSEDINSGNLFNMQNYLVEIGEQKKDSRKSSTLENETLKIKSHDVDNIKLSKRIPANRPLLDGEPPKRALSLTNNDSKAKNSVPDKLISTTVSIDKPLRDARSILSFLKKPTVNTEKPQDSCISTSDVAVHNEENSKTVDSNISLPNSSNDSNNKNPTNTDFPSFDLGFD